jgi:hypothetical protein
MATQINLPIQFLNTSFKVICETASKVSEFRDETLLLKDKNFSAGRALDIRRYSSIMVPIPEFI